MKEVLKKGLLYVSLCLYLLSLYETHWFWEYKGTMVFYMALALDFLYQVLRTRDGVKVLRRSKNIWIEGVVVCLVFVLAVLALMSSNSLVLQLLLFTGVRCYSWFVVKSAPDEPSDGTDNLNGSSNFLQRLLNKLQRHPQLPIFIVSAVSLVQSLFVSMMSMVFLPLNEIGAQLAIPVLWLLLTVSLQRRLKLNLTIARVILFVAVIFLSASYLVVYKALVPTNYQEQYGLSKRSSNYAMIGGWDWGISWLRFSATPEEMKTVLANMSWTIEVEGDYRTYPMIKDSVLAIPPYNRGFSDGFDPFKKIKTPCQHWHVDEETHLPFNVYYDAESETVEIFKTDEMDMDPRARY